MKKAIDIKNWKTGEIIFSHTCEDNTIKKTVEEAVKQGINLAYADLKDTDLSNVNLSHENLSNAILDYTDLSYSDLSYTDLSNANLCNINLRYSNLSYSSLRYVDLSSANLFNANLSYSDLSHTDLSNANLNSTNLRYTNLSYSKLNYAYLPNADLLNTNLSNAVLYNTYLDCSDLSNAILDNVKGLNDQCPKEGSFIGWKKCYNKLCFYIVKLEILADAKRSSSTGIKCRCDKAKVLEIQNLNGSKSDVNEVCSWVYPTFKYKVGNIVEVPDFDERYWIECSRGIHFFIDREDAVGF